jgi:hypothetical protein
MSIVLIALAMLAFFALASAIAVYSCDRFADRAQGESSFPLPVLESGTPLDDLVAPLMQARPEQSGLLLLSGNLDAFATRALAARHAGRSLDLQYYLWKDDLTGRLLLNEIVQAHRSHDDASSAACSVVLARSREGPSAKKLMHCQGGRAVQSRTVQAQQIKVGEATAALNAAQALIRADAREIQGLAVADERPDDATRSKYRSNAAYASGLAY